MLAARAAVAQTIPSAEPAPSPVAAVAPEEDEKPFAASESYDKAERPQPYVMAQLLGGQYFLGSQEGGLAGNASLVASQVFKPERLGDRWSLIPMFTARYQGTKELTDLVGGGTLAQQVMDYQATVKGVYQASTNWKLKPEAGYKLEYLKETRDERWGRGLFDYHRPNAGVEAEYLYKDPFTIRLGYDFYHIGFQNYTSLESQVQGQASGSLARELAGASVINSDNHAMTLGGSVEGPWRSYLEGSYGLTLRRFPEQHVVIESGDLGSTIREDVVRSLGVAWRFPRPWGQDWRLVPGVVAGLVRNNSNQNSYDAEHTTFLKDFYNSTSANLGLDLSASRALGGDRRVELRASAGYGRVGYPGRLAQDESGLYGTDTIYENVASLGLSASYPIAPHFVWTAQLGWLHQTSNQAFEKLYQYNFSATNYLLGFTYEY